MQEELFKRVRQRNEDAFLDMLQIYRDQLFKTAITYLKNETDALEAIQEVSYRAYKHIHKVTHPKYMKTWLIRIMMNYCLDELKQRQRMSPVATFFEQSTFDEDSIAKIDIQERIERLKKRYQIIVILKYYHQYTLTEIAESLNLPLGTVKTRLNKALGLLREDIGKGDEYNGRYRKKAR